MEHLHNIKTLFSTRGRILSAMLIVLAGAVLGAQYISAQAVFTEPSCGPTGCNTLGPITVGTVGGAGQVKNDGLSVNGFLNTGTTALIGNVGINTTSPLGDLDIKGDAAGGGGSRTNQLFIEGASDANKKLYIGINTSGNYASIENVDENVKWGPLALEADGGPNDGFVGIGTTAPVTKLNVIGNVAASAYCDVSGAHCFTAASVATSTGSGGTTPTLQAVTAVGNTTSLGLNITAGNLISNGLDHIYPAAGGANYFYVEAPSGNDTSPVRLGSYNATSGTGGFRALSLDASTLAVNTESGGNVGIGTASPAVKLTVAGNVGATQYCDQNGSNCFTPSSSLGGGGGITDAPYFAAIFTDNAGKNPLAFNHSGYFNDDNKLILSTDGFIELSPATGSAIPELLAGGIYATAIGNGGSETIAGTETIGTAANNGSETIYGNQTVTGLDQLSTLQVSKSSQLQTLSVLGNAQFLGNINAGGETVNAGVINLDGSEIYLGTGSTQGSAATINDNQGGTIAVGGSGGPNQVSMAATNNGSITLGTGANSVDIVGTNGGTINVNGTNRNAYLQGNVGGLGTVGAQQICIIGSTCKTTWADISDVRLKKDIAPLQDSLANIMKLKPVSYEFKDPKNGTGPQIGLIAQDVQQVYPQVVTTNASGTEAIYYEKLVAPLIGAVQEQQGEIKTLQDENASLTVKVENLEESK